MYDCLLKALLSNFSVLEDLSEKILDFTVLKNRIILTNNQISQSLIVFKRSSRYIVCKLVPTPSLRF